jgi:hypothetical protein
MLLNWFKHKAAGQEAAKARLHKIAEPRQQVICRIIHRKSKKVQIRVDLSAFYF